MSNQTLSGLSLSYLSVGYSRRKVIEDPTVPHLPRRKTTTLLRPSDSGKSMLMRTMAGPRLCHDELPLEGESLLTRPFSRCAEQTIYLPQTLFAGAYLHMLEPIIVTQHVTGGCRSPQHQEKVVALLQQLEITHLVVDYPGQLSDGQK